MQYPLSQTPEPNERRVNGSEQTAAGGELQVTTAQGSGLQAPRSHPYTQLVVDDE